MNDQELYEAHEEPNGQRTFTPATVRPEEGHTYYKKEKGSDGVVKYTPEGYHDQHPLLQGNPSGSTSPQTETPADGELRELRSLLIATLATGLIVAPVYAVGFPLLYGKVRRAKEAGATVRKFGKFRNIGWTAFAFAIATTALAVGLSLASAFQTYRCHDYHGCNCRVGVTYPSREACLAAYPVTQACPHQGYDVEGICHADNNGVPLYVTAGAFGIIWLLFITLGGLAIGYIASGLHVDSPQAPTPNLRSQRVAFLTTLSIGLVVPPVFLFGFPFVFYAIDKVAAPSFRSNVHWRSFFALSLLSWASAIVSSTGMLYSTLGNLLSSHSLGNIDLGQITLFWFFLIVFGIAAIVIGDKILRKMEHVSRTPLS